MKENKDGAPFLLNKEDYELISDIAEAIVPSGDNPDEEPGSREVGTINYIDSVLLDAEDAEMKMLRDVLSAIRSETRRQGAVDFRELSAEKKHLLLNGLFDRGKTKDAYIFLRSLCLEGFYSDYHDPDYNGVTAWKLLEFGGPRISELDKDWSFLRIYSDSKEKV
ncbi:MAG TPA: gluconate 2-dehydrogenase subunit 3 family protein [Thermoplasmataceae archaeon]|nr:gluconate 2-dehydrogenase subunit 3 family protein [Thermoplasmataceae archaeon]